MMAIDVFFLENKDLLVDFIDKIKVSHEKTAIKFGAKAESNISIHFFIHGELIKDSLPYEDKIRLLFNTNEDLLILNKVINEIDSPFHFSFGPYLRISKENEPLIHAFQITVLFDRR